MKIRNRSPYVLAFALLLVIFAPAVYLVTKNASPTSAAWFNDAWGYRQTIAITNAGTAQTDYQISFVLDTAALITAGKMQSDCDDIRITDINGKLLPHWIEESNPGCNQATTKIWTKAPSIPTTGATLYLYYGNLSATSFENPTQVFIFFDNFTSDLSRWTNPSGCAGTISSGVLQISTSTGCDSTPMYITSLNLSDDSGYAMDFRGKFSSGGSGRLQTYQRYRSTNSHLARFWITGTITYYQEASPGFGANTDIGNSGMSADTWYNLSAKVVGTNNTWIVNGTTIGSNVTSAATLLSETDLTVGLGQYQTTVQYDNVRVRKTAATEPSAGSPASEEKSQGPVAYWKFDEGYGTTTQDSTANNNDGTISGATWQTEDQCNSGKCLKYSGTTEYTDVTNSKTKFSNSDSFTVQGWFLKNANKDTNSVFVQQASANKFSYAIAGNNDGTVNGNISKSGVGSNVANSTTVVPLNTWNHIVMVFNGTNIVLYVNGKQEATTTYTYGALSAADSSAYIGNDSGSPAGARTFNGRIDDVKIYNYARTAAQIKADYAARGTSKGSAAVLSSSKDQGNFLSNGLVGYWKMDEGAGAGSTLADSSGNSNTGTAVLWGGGNTATDSAHVTGKFGNAFSFDGGDDAILVPDNSTLDGFASMSVFFWAKPAGSAVKEMVIKHLSTTSDINWELFQNGSNISGRIAGSAVTCTSTGSLFTTSVWHHVGMTWDGVNIYVFIDGLLNNTCARSATMTNSVGNLSIGRYEVSSGSNYPFSGQMDDIRIYNRALSPKEVRDLYNWAPGPLIYYDLNEKTGTTSINDKSGNGYTATLTSMAENDWVTGKYGSSLEFDGTTNQYAQVPSGIPAQSNNITAEAWVYPTSISGAGVDRNNFVYSSYYMALGTNKFSTYTPGTSSQGWHTGTITINTNQWQHVAFSYDGANMKTYVNGVLDQNVSMTGNLTPITTLDIGRRPDVGSNPYLMQGKIDDFRVYNYARTQKQIVEDMNAGHPAVGSPVGSAVGHWKFDEGAANTCSGGTNDTCNAGNQGKTLDGAINGTVSYTQSGKFDKAISPDGTTGYISVADDASLDFGTNDFSISAWLEFPLAGSSVWNGIVSKGYTTSAPANTWGLTSGNPATDLVYQDATNAGGAWNVTVSYAAASLSGWHHVVVTRSGTAYVMYVDAISKATGTGLSTVNLSNASALQFANAGSRFFSKDIDEVKIYNYALTSDEVKLEYNRGSAQMLGSTGTNSSGTADNSAAREYCIPGDTTSCAAPIGRWDFEEAFGSTVRDTSGTGITGTWTGSNTHYAPGKFGKAGVFPGTDYINNLSYTGTVTSFTAQFWIYRKGNLASTARSAPIGYSGSGHDFVIEVYNDGSNHWINVSRATSWGANGKYWSCTNTIIPQNQWTFVTVTSNNTDTGTKCYLNGILKDSPTVGTWGAGAYPTSGTEFTMNYQFSVYLDSLIDRVQVYDYARTPAQIAWDYNRGGPVGWWKLDECQGATANDASGNGNNGTITIGATGTQDELGTCTSPSDGSGAWYNGQTGKFNSSMNLDGTNDYISAPTSNSLSFGTGDFSMSMWVYPTSFSAEAGLYDSLVIGGVGSRVNAFVLVRNITTGKLRIFTNGAYTSSTTGALTLNAWNHVTIARSGTTVSFYFNGVVDPITVAVSTDITSGNAVMGRYSDVSSGYFSGQLDDVRVYNYALTATQVKDVYNQGASVRFGPASGIP